MNGVPLPCGRALLAHGASAERQLVRAIPRNLYGHPDEQHADDRDDNQDAATARHAADFISQPRIVNMPVALYNR